MRIPVDFSENIISFFKIRIINNYIHMPSNLISLLSKPFLDITAQQKYSKYYKNICLSTMKTLFHIQL